MRLWLCWLLLLWTVPAWATDYYISPTGADGNPGTLAQPWLTFNHALNTGMAGSGSSKGCGHTLILLNGVYGDGTSTGKIALSGRVCTAGAPLTIKALNSRQARIHDNGTFRSVYVFNSAYLIFDGLVVNSTNNAATSSEGQPFISFRSDRITLRNSLCRNPNKYANVHCITSQGDGGFPSSNFLVVDTEIYDFHRHAVAMSGSGNVARRVYCNGRAGGIVGGYDGGPEPGHSSVCITQYPSGCQNCIAENIIYDATSATGNISDMPASGSTDGSKILGSMNTRANTCMNLEARIFSGSTIITPTNNTLTNNVCLNSASNSISAKTARNITINHNTIIGTASLSVFAAGEGIQLSIYNGTSSAQLPSATVKDNIVMNWNNGQAAYRFDSQYTWSASRNYSFNNGTPYNPATSSNYTPNPNSQANPQLGSCYLWMPDASSLKGTATDGGDPGATILYAYQNGVLTSTKLWNTTTGQWNFVGATVAGINNVAGDSLFDVHTRLNVNRNGCAFPASYTGGSPPDTTPPAAPTGLVLT